MKVTSSSSFKRPQSTDRTQMSRPPVTFCAELCGGGFRVADIRTAQLHRKDLSGSSTSETPGVRWLSGQITPMNHSVIEQTIEEHSSQLSNQNERDNLSKLSFYSNHNRLYPDKGESSIKESNHTDSQKSVGSSMSKVTCFQKNQSAWHKKEHAEADKQPPPGKDGSFQTDNENTPMDLMSSHLSQISSVNATPMLVADAVTPRLGLTSGLSERSPNEMESELRIFKDIWQLNEQKRKVVFRQFERQQRHLKQSLTACRAQLTAKEVLVNDLQARCKQHEKDLLLLRNESRLKQLRVSGSVSMNKLQKSQDNGFMEDNLAKALSDQFQSRIIRAGEQDQKQRQPCCTDQQLKQLQQKLISSEYRFAQHISEVQQKLGKQLQLCAAISQDNQKLKSNNLVLATEKKTIEARMEKCEVYQGTAQKLQSSMRLIVDIVTRSGCQCCSTAKLLIRNLKFLDEPLQGSLDFNLSDASEYESRLCNSSIPPRNQ